MTARYRLRPALIAVPHLARMVPWAVTVAGCAAGLAISVAAYLLAAPFQSPPGVLLQTRAALAPVVIGLAFGAADRQRALTAALPVPVWAGVMVRVAVMLPVLAGTAWIQLWLADGELRTATSAVAGSDAPGSAGGATHHLVAATLAAGLAAWSAMALAAGLLVARTRWRDLAGAIAVPATMALVALLAAAPVHLFPSDIAAGQRQAWLRAEWGWWALCLLAFAVAAWASRDPWRRLAIS